MKALDTSVLLALLEGEAGSRELLRKLRGVEVATTEANVLELAYLAVRGPERHRRARLEALGRLRRKLTVLPIDGRAVETASRSLAKAAGAALPASAAILGALESAGCEELLTLDASAFPAKGRVRVTRVRLKGTK